MPHTLVVIGYFIASQDIWFGSYFLHHHRHHGDVQSLFQNILRSGGHTTKGWQFLRFSHPEDCILRYNFASMDVQIPTFRCNVMTSSTVEGSKENETS